MPDGPPATPLREERRFLPNSFSSRSKGMIGWCSMISRGSASPRLGGSALSVCQLVQRGPGPWRHLTAFPKPTGQTRARQDAPTALPSSRGASTSLPPLRRRCRTRPMVAFSSQAALAARSCLHSRLEKASKRATNFDPWDEPSTRGSMKQHPRQQHEELPSPFLPHFIVLIIPPCNVGHTLHHRCSLAKTLHTGRLRPE